MNSFSLTLTHSLQEGECQSFEMQTNEGMLRGFIVKSNGQLYAYRNQCPHAGVNLEWQPNQFLDASEEYIQCATHGAKFRIEDGLCIYGPCQGQSLIAMTVQPTNNSIDEVVINAKEPEKNQSRTSTK